MGIGSGVDEHCSRVVAKKLDQAASKGVIHRNAAARQKSRLSKALKKAKAGAK